LCPKVWNSFVLFSCVARHAGTVVLRHVLWVPCDFPPPNKKNRVCGRQGAGDMVGNRQVRQSPEQRETLEPKAMVARTVRAACGAQCAIPQTPSPKHPPLGCPVSQYRRKIIRHRHRDLASGGLDLQPGESAARFSLNASQHRCGVLPAPHCGSDWRSSVSGKEGKEFEVRPTDSPRTRHSCIGGAAGVLIGVCQRTTAEPEPWIKGSGEDLAAIDQSPKKLSLEGKPADR
jgi:hypothetical protein